jgi:hypothetical protein
MEVDFDNNNAVPTFSSLVRQHFTTNKIWKNTIIHYLLTLKYNKTPHKLFKMADNNIKDKSCSAKCQH